MPPTDEISILPSQTEFVSLGFLADLKRYITEKPYFMQGTKDRPGDFILTNILTDFYTNVPVSDVRGFEQAFNLDTHGFELLRHSTCMSNEDFDDDETLKRVYYKEMEDLIKSSLKAKSARVMQSSVRERPVEFETLGHEQRTEKSKGRKLPLTGLHIDASPQGALARIRALWPDEFESITSKRFQILNIWRPLRSDLSDWPLLLCDARSVAEDDKVEADLLSPGFQGENTFLYFSPHYKFYFLHKQKRDEVWVFKQFDSELGVASSCPHGSFKNPRTSKDDPPRLSVDVAILVTY